VRRRRRRGSGLGQPRRDRGNVSAQRLSGRQPAGRRPRAAVRKPQAVSDLSAQQRTRGRT
jgi:hypothetical protein